MDIELLSLLFLAFGLGMLHALDADHVMAVTGLSCQNSGRNASLLYCSRWAFGHGGVLMVIGTAVIFLGMAIPQELSALAENLVGLALIIIGLMVLRSIFRQHAHLHFHQHSGLPDHAHWHSHQDSVSGHQHNHAPVLVGMLHGAAGSAPLLVLLPLSTFSSPWIGMSYLLLFGLGVFIAMAVFGGLLGKLFDWMKNRGTQFINGLRIVVSLGTIGYGAKLVMVAL